MTATADLIHAELTAVTRSLHNNHTALIRVAREAEGTSVGDLIRRVMEWRRDPRKSVWLHTMLFRVVDCGPTTFLPSFLAFLQVLPKVSARPPFALDWVGSTGRLLSKDNVLSRPEVRAGSKGVDAFTAPVLLDAMDLYERRQMVLDARNAYLEGMVDDG